MLVLFDSVLWGVYCSCALEGLYLGGGGRKCLGIGLEIVGRKPNAML